MGRKRDEHLILSLRIAVHSAMCHSVQLSLERQQCNCVRIGFVVIKALPILCNGSMYGDMTGCIAGSVGCCWTRAKMPKTGDAGKINA